MAIASPHEVTDKAVVPVDRIEGLACQQAADDDFELVDIFAPPLAAFKVLSELLRVDRFVHQRPSLLNMSSASSQTTKSRPASESSNVCFVVAVGTTTSKGSPSRSSTCL